MAPTVVILKKNCSLRGKDLLPVAAALRALAPEVQDWAQFDKTRTLQDMSMDDMTQALHAVLGCGPEDILPIADLDVTEDSMRRLCHVAIKCANETGGPSKQKLLPSTEGATPGAAPSKAPAGGPSAPKTPRLEDRNVDLTAPEVS